MRSAQGNISMPWRCSTASRTPSASCRRSPPQPIVTPQIAPVMAVPVLNPASDFLFQRRAATPRPAHNPGNDIEANIVLGAPTASGLQRRHGADHRPATRAADPAQQRHPFRPRQEPAPLVNWGDTNNAKLLTQLLTSVLGLNTVPMSASRPARLDRGHRRARSGQRRRPLHHLSRPQRSHRERPDNSGSRSIRTSTATRSSITTARPSTRFRPTTSPPPTER